MRAVQVGTVEILRPRAYRLDPASVGPTGTEAIVDPGVYPLYAYENSVFSRFWVMEGRLNGDFSDRGDGMFVLQGGDEYVEGFTVRFPSRTFGKEAWAELLEETVVREGHPEQRIRIRED